MRQPKLFGQCKGFAQGDHGYRKHHVVADFDTLPRTGTAAMHDLLAHVLQHGLGRRKRLVVAAALSPIAAPSAFAWSRDAATRSNAVTLWPALTRLATIGPPILPRPMNAMFAMSVSSAAAFL